MAGVWINHRGHRGQNRERRLRAYRNTGGIDDARTDWVLSTAER